MATTLNTFGSDNLNNAAYATLYTAPALTRTLVTSCIFCNKTATDKTVSVQVVRAGGVPVLQVLNLEPIPANSALELVQGKPITLLAGDLLKAQASAANALDSCGSVLELT